MLDLILRNGWLVDGTGAPGRRADVGVKGGRLVAIGDVDDSATRTVNCDGLVVAPGFVDPHTHYDPQIMWDPAVTPSSLHGVTTVIGGNCGFTIAPMEPPHEEYLIPMLARVEGMPVDALWAGLDLDWKSFGSWLDRLDDNVAVNAGFLCGHSTIRRLVMGDAAVGEKATPEHLEAMVRLLHESLSEGALGFSSSLGQAHSDHQGNPVPSRHAAREEFLELCGALTDHDGTWIEFIPSIERLFTDYEIDLMSDMSAAAGGRVLNWNLMGVRPGSDEEESRLNKLGASDRARERGGNVVALTLPEPMTMRLSFQTGFLYDSLPDWRDVMHAPDAQKLKLLADPSVRRMMIEGARAFGYRSYTDWATSRVADVVNPALKHLEGRTFGSIASERRVDPFDALCDIVIEDRLLTGIEPDLQGDDEDSWHERVELFRDPRVLIGGSDAGAHVDMMKTFGCLTHFLGEYVRDRGYVSLEEGVHLITDAPARLFGLRDRGRLEEGYCADVCVFEAERINRGPIHMVRDLPSGAERLTAEADGVEHVFVNGVEIAHDGALTGATPGTVFRSGRDTETVLEG
jgi:N-acyl-D-aspartate/D-glutamate deacylase